MAEKTPWFVKRDLDGFFGLFVDNIVQLLVITELGVAVSGLTREFVYKRILPGGDHRFSAGEKKGQGAAQEAFSI